MKILTSRQEAKRNMYDVVILKCDANLPIIATNAALLAAFEEFKAVIDNITAAAPLSAVVTTGITTDKQVSKADLSQITATIAGQIYAYAAKTGNNELKDSVDFSASQLKKIKDGEIAVRCQTIHDLGVSKKDVLADYGVTLAKLAALQAAIDSYTQSAPKPRSAITDRATVKANIRNYFAQADALLTEQMDKLVETLTEDQPDFVQTYKNARIIVDPKTKKKENGTGTEGGGNTPA